MLATGRPSVHVVALVADGTVSLRDDACTDEKFAQRGHSVVMPDGLAPSVVFVGYALIFEPTVECRLWW